MIYKQQIMKFIIVFYLITSLKLSLFNLILIFAKSLKLSVIYNNFPYF